MSGANGGLPGNLCGPRGHRLMEEMLMPVSAIVCFDQNMEQDLDLVTGAQSHCMNDKWLEEDIDLFCLDFMMWWWWWWW